MAGVEIGEVLNKNQTIWLYMAVSKNRGTPKMDGENKGKPYEQMDDLGGKLPYFWVQHPYVFL